MMNKFSRSLLILGLLVFSSSISASQPLSQRAHQMLSQVYESMGKEQWETALLQLEQAQERLEKELPALASVLHLRGHANTRLERYDAALENYQSALRSGGLSEPVQQQARYAVAQLALMLERYEEAVAAIEQWLQVEAEPASQARMIAASAYLNSGRYVQAAEQVRLAIESEAQPPEQWYQILLAAWYELDEMKELLVWLPRVIERFPQQYQYWTQLAGLHVRMENTDQALAVLDAAYRQGLLREERDILNLVQLHRQAAAPLLAARVLSIELDKGSVKPVAKNYQLLADSWLQAQENRLAVDAYYQAIELGAGAVVKLRLARQLMRDEQPQQALELLAAAKQGFDAEHMGEALLLEGMAAYEAGEQETARRAFLQAATHTKVGKTAKQWLAFLGQGDASVN